MSRSTATYELVTPSDAEHFLMRNRVNRKLRDAVVKRYANDMKHGNWTGLSHQGIALSEHGELLDGQHRLSAIIKNGVPETMLVVRGVPANAQLTMDSGKIRQEADELSFELGCKVDPKQVALMKAMLQLQTSERYAWSRPTLKAYYIFYRDAVEFAWKNAQPLVPKITWSPVTSVIARAYYSQPQSVLEHFSHILRTGFMTEGGEAVILLRNYLLTDSRLHARKNGNRTSSKSVEAHRKTARALYAFIHGERLKLLKVTKDDYFPIPKFNQTSG